MFLSCSLAALNPLSSGVFAPSPKARLADGRNGEGACVRSEHGAPSADETSNIERERAFHDEKSDCDQYVRCETELGQMDTESVEIFGPSVRNC